MRMSTCSKALGAQGAWVSGSREAVFYLRSYAKPYVFTTALAQPTLAAIDAALDVLQAEPERRQRLHSNRERLATGLRAQGFEVGESFSGIVPVYLRDGLSGRFNQRLYEQGLFANLMEYPMVAPGSERLRFSLMSDHCSDDIDQALAIMSSTAAQLALPLRAGTTSHAA
jgi:glycine C-acetyltransferase